MLKDKTVLLGVTGSIAAYKIASLASMLVKQGVYFSFGFVGLPVCIIGNIVFEIVFHFRS